jgi:hypothetical protein
MATKEKTDKGIETIEVDPTTLPVEELVRETADAIRAQDEPKLETFGAELLLRAVLGLFGMFRDINRIANKMTGELR